MSIEEFRAKLPPELVDDYDSVILGILAMGAPSILEDWSKRHKAEINQRGDEVLELADNAIHQVRQKALIQQEIMKRLHQAYQEKYDG